MKMKKVSLPKSRMHNFVATSNMKNCDNLPSDLCLAMYIPNPKQIHLTPKIRV